ncbi:hypothetical protein ACFV80_08160 [Streptomyces sp. NPDC059862]|uniref:hypothetical protein n=1 Tax=Streptomyces sp. NPDC059862 TaxID=3346975 RepID=UPI0036663D3F
MRKFQKAAVVVAMLGSVSFLGAGVAQADDGPNPKLKIDNQPVLDCGTDITQKGLVNVAQSPIAVNLGIAEIGTADEANPSYNDNRVCTNRAPFDGQ